jgi:hypothetical protein
VPKPTRSGRENQPVRSIRAPFVRRRRHSVGWKIAFAVIGAMAAPSGRDGNICMIGKAASALILLLPAMAIAQGASPSLALNHKGYFAERGLDVMVFSDYYPDGHQTGVTIVQHGTRVAANGDLRLEAAPGAVVAGACRRQAGDRPGASDHYRDAVLSRPDQESHRLQPDRLSGSAIYVSGQCRCSG